MALPSPEKQPPAVGEETQIARVVERVGEAAPEIVPEHVHHLPQGGRCESAPPEGAERHQFEHVDRRIPSLRESAGTRAPRRDGRRKNATDIPALQLPRRQPRQARDFTRAVARLKPHAVFPAGNRLAI